MTAILAAQLLDADCSAANNSSMPAEKINDARVRRRLHLRKVTREAEAVVSRVDRMLAEGFKAANQVAAEAERAKVSRWTKLVRWLKGKIKEIRRMVSRK